MQEKETDGPFQSEFDTDLKGVVRRELITYRYKDGVMIKEQAVRVYTADDYNDSKSVMPMQSWGK